MYKAHNYKNISYSDVLVIIHTSSKYKHSYRKCFNGLSAVMCNIVPDFIYCWAIYQYNIIDISRYQQYNQHFFIIDYLWYVHVQLAMFKLQTCSFIDKKR